MEKSTNKKYHILAKAVWSAPTTALDSWSSKTQAPPGTCYKCGQQGHWTKTCPNFQKPRGSCHKCHQEGYWAVDCPHVMHENRGISLPDNPPDDLLGLAIADWGGPSSPGLTIAITSRELQLHIMKYGQLISFLLDTGATYSRLSFGDPLLLSIVVVGGQPYFPHQTPPLCCSFRDVPLIHSFLVVPTCPGSYWERIF